MFHHHLKLAFRNLRKYKTQNIISIIGLAIGFTCFAFSALWIRYEMSYDSFHAKADRIYRVQMDRYKWTIGMGTNTSEITEWSSYQLVNWLKSDFPEIEDACGIQSRSFGKFSVLFADYSFCNIFDVNIPENLFIQGRTDRPVAVTNNHKDATEFIKEEYKFDVQTVIPRWQANTNIPFDIIAPITLAYNEQILNSWGYLVFHTYILVRDGVNVQALMAKLDKIELPDDRRSMRTASAGTTVTMVDSHVSFVLTPLKQLRYKDPAGNMLSEIKFNHIQIFAIAGLLVILCSLFNHLTLYVTRVRMRLREFALRKVNGATNWQIAATLYIDFLLVIVLSLIVGLMLMALLLPTFKEYATIGNNNINIYAELMLYAVLLIVCGIIVGGIPVMYFRKQALNESIKGFGSPGSGNVFRKACLLVQLIISLGMIFCAAIFIKQIRFLHHTDLGVNRHNIAAISGGGCCMLTPPYADRIKQVPGVIDALPITSTRFLGNMTSGSSMLTFEKDDGERGTVNVFSILADAKFFDFFGVEIIEGMGHSNESRDIVLNETAKKELGDNNPQSKNIIGVVRDFYLTPTTKAKPIQISYPFFDRFGWFQALAYKYEEGMRKQTQQAVTQWLRKEFPDQGEFEIIFEYMEDVYEEHFKSERALLSLLSVMTLACILIAIFGVYSLTSLTCQQRRKEIAIRKVHGAEVVDIMNIFFKEYLILLALAALAAFPAGYLIMKRWLEGYVKQTSMEAWLFVAIFLAVFVVIVFSILSTVWRAANRNPAEVVKSE